VLGHYREDHMLGTAEAVRLLQSEGYRISKTRLENLIATGRVESPQLVGPTRVWMDDDINHVRRILTSIDGAPRRGGV
jgi:hypothetical protein